MVLKQTSQAGAGFQMPPLKVCVGFYFKFPNAWREGTKILVGCGCRQEGELEGLLLLGEGLGCTQSSSLTHQGEILLPTKHTGNWEGRTNASVFNALPAAAAKQKLTWNMMGAFVQCCAFPPLPLPDLQLQDERKDNFFPFDRVAGQDNALGHVGFLRAES